MKISIVIPHWPRSQELNDLLRRCVKSLKGYDELVVVVNEGTGFAKAVNQGLQLASGDFVCVVNNDIEQVSGDIRDMCKEGVVTSPILNDDKSDFFGCFFCIPRNVLEDVGYLDERFETGYFEDDDYLIRVVRAGYGIQGIDSVKIVSEGSQTMKDVGGRHDIFMRNKEVFKEKWGDYPEDLKDHPLYKHKHGKK